MGDKTAMQQAIERVESMITIRNTHQWELLKKEFLIKEKEQIENSVNNTIDAYNFYVESPHNPPPMNGTDYYTKKYNQ